jgi:hypothetical protein
MAMTRYTGNRTRLRNAGTCLASIWLAGLNEPKRQPIGSTIALMAAAV